MKCNEKPNKELAKRVRELRISKKLTQKELANKLNYSEKYISDWENCRRRITRINAELLSHIFNIDPNYLLDEKIEYKSDIDKFNVLLHEAKTESVIMASAIYFLAQLNGFNVTLSEFENHPNIENYFQARKEYMTFYKNQKKIFSLSDSEVIKIGNNLSEILMSTLKWNYCKDID